MSLAGYGSTRGADKPPAAGKTAPDFTLNSQEGKPVSLHDFHGKWVVLYFYPKDFTSGCTTEAHNFQRDLSQYEQKNAVILGVSVQSSQSHQEFCAKEGLSFKLLADTNHKVSAAYGSVMNLAITKLSSRRTFLINPEGVIVREFLDVNPSKHSEEVLARGLQGLKPHRTPIVNVAAGAATYKDQEWPSANEPQGKPFAEGTQDRREFAQ